MLLLNTNIEVVHQSRNAMSNSVFSPPEDNGLVWWCGIEYQLEGYPFLLW